MKDLTRRILRTGGLLAALVAGSGSVRAATTLLPYGSGWYTHDQGYEPGANWHDFGYDEGDYGWGFYFGQFGYGDGDEETVLSYGPDDENKYITTYFRTYVYIADPNQFTALIMNLIRDDGVVVYINGVEALREGMPGGPIYYETYADHRLLYPEESEAISRVLSPGLFFGGYNLIAVEIHQYEAASPDMSFDLELIGNTGGGGGAPAVTRGPYLQAGTSSNLVVRWRTSVASSTRVTYGTNLAELNLGASNAALAVDHEMTLPGLRPDTKYYYSIGTLTQALAGDATHFFQSSPLPGPARPTRIWAIGDFGTGYSSQHQVRDAYYNFTTNRPTDVWLMLGDNAYGQGFDHEYQNYVFNIYPTLLRQTVVWPTMGNHETGFGSQALTDNYDYYRIFTMPTNGQAGGLASGTEHYYSFDFANIHFVCLDSMTQVFRQPGSAMLQWLEADLADNSRDWVVAYFHHPPYSKGSHYSDYEEQLTEVRQNILPVLEKHGVDLVLVGHSHAYERSKLIDGQYDYSWNLNPTNFINAGDGSTNGDGAYLKPAGGMGAGGGTVYVVDGSSGGQYGGGELDHPVMHYSTLTAGSLVVDVDGLRLDGRFLSESGTIDDAFTIFKGDYPGTPPPAMKMARTATNAVISWPTSFPDYELVSAPDVPAAQWLPPAGPTAVQGRRKSYSIPPGRTNEFFRLRRVP